MLVATTEPTTARAVTVTGLRNATPVYLTVTAAELGLALGPSSAPSNTVTPFGPPFRR